MVDDAHRLSAVIDDPNTDCFGLLRSTALCAEEAIKDALNIVEMTLLDILAMLEPISEDRCAGATHQAQLLAPIRQVFHRR